MKVLIIEDDEFKQKRIEHSIRNLMPSSDVFCESSVNSGLKGIVALLPELILLDMSLTTFDVGPTESGGRPQNFGGMEVLRQMERLNISIPVIVITQYERFVAGSGEVLLSAVQRELRERHGQVFRGLVYYNSAAGDWERDLRVHIREIERDIRKGTGGKHTRRRRQR